MPRWAYAFIHNLEMSPTLGQFDKKGQASFCRVSRCLTLQGPDNLGAFRTQEIFNEKWAAEGFLIPGVALLHNCPYLGLRCRQKGRMQCP